MFDSLPEEVNGHILSFLYALDSCDKRDLRGKVAGLSRSWMKSVVNPGCYLEEPVPGLRLCKKHDQRLLMAHAVLVKASIDSDIELPFFYVHVDDPVTVDDIIKIIAIMNTTDESPSYDPYERCCHGNGLCVFRCGFMYAFNYIPLL